MNNNRTYTAKSEDLAHDWWVVDATNLPLGRLATGVASLIRGKHKPTFSPHLDGGDFVIVVNAEKVQVTSGKSRAKIYYRHSGYPGGLRTESFEHLQARRPQRIIEQAVKGMLPKNRLGRRLIHKLKVYAGPDHPHHAQQPKPLDLNIRKVDA